MYPPDYRLKLTYLSPPTLDPGNGTETDWQNYYNVTNSGDMSESSVQMYLNTVENSWKTDEYPDGTYKVKVKTYAYPPLDSAFSFAERLVVTNNFRPYVERVEIFDSLGQRVYLREWNPVPMLPNLLQSPHPELELPFIPGNAYSVIATFSEQMAHTDIYFSGVPIVSPSFTYFPEEHKTRLTGSFQVPNVVRDEIRPLTIQGEDSGYKEILALNPVNGTVINPATQLTRDAYGNMQGQGGDDTLHGLRIDVAPPIIIWQRTPGESQEFECSAEHPELCGTLSSPINIATNSVWFTYKDIGSGIKVGTIRKLSGEVVYTSTAAAGTFLVPATTLVA